MKLDEKWRELTEEEADSISPEELIDNKIGEENYYETFARLYSQRNGCECWYIKLCGNYVVFICPK